MFGVPWLDPLPAAGDAVFAARSEGPHDRGPILQRQLQRAPFRQRGRPEQRRQRAVGLRIERRIEQTRAGPRLQVDGAEDAAEEPPVGHALGAIDRTVGRLLRHAHLDAIFGAEAQQRRDVVIEFIEGAPMDGTCRAAVDRHLGVGHHPLEDEAHPPSAPGGRHLERAAVDPLLAGRLGGALLVPAAVTVGPEALLLPLRGDPDALPRTAAAARRAIEIPCHGIVRSAAREVDALVPDRRRRGTGRRRERQPHEQPNRPPADRAPSDGMQTKTLPRGEERVFHDPIVRCVAAARAARARSDRSRPSPSRRTRRVSAARRC